MSEPIMQHRKHIRVRVLVKLLYCSILPSMIGDELDALR